MRRALLTGITGQDGAYLAKFLLEKGLISLEQGTSEYKLTEQGLHFLRVYSEISEIVSIKTAGKAENLVPNFTS